MKNKKVIIIIAVVVALGIIGSVGNSGKETPNSTESAGIIKTEQKQDNQANEADNTDKAEAEQNNVETLKSENTEETASTKNNTDSDISNENPKENLPTSDVENSDTLNETSPKTAIEDVIRNRITEQYSNTSIDSVTINDDLGTETDGDFIALVYLTWNVENSAETSKEVLELYSNDLAATMAESCPNVQELAVFWEVPYLDANAKCSYERKGGGMYTMDNTWVGFN